MMLSDVCLYDVCLLRMT